MQPNSNTSAGCPQNRGAIRNNQLHAPNWQREELRRRKDRFLTNPASGRSWEQVKRWVRAHQR